MNAAQTVEFRKRLLDERERILAELKAHLKATGPAAGWDMRDLEERPLEITNDDLERQLAEDDRNLLEKIDFALQRLDEGAYDRCANCGQPIPLERLEAKPAVSLCIPCQEARDAAKEAEFVPPR
jgi:DnaK suppressor protein